MRLTNSTVRHTASKRKELIPVAVKTKSRSSVKHRFRLILLVTILAVAAILGNLFLSNWLATQWVNYTDKDVRAVITSQATQVDMTPQHTIYRQWATNLRELNKQEETALAAQQTSMATTEITEETTNTTTEDTTTTATTNAATAPPADFSQFRYDSFNHGYKPASQQKYIVLHDTEGGGTPLGVAQYWTGANDGAVAAHFVIGRDGSIVQCADLDQILHHAGWGGPGNADNVFGVGNNDGNGAGDDLVGVVPLEGFTSYGMNSYSIGIEMVHQGGQDYPEAQLKALDRVIAYIDDYYGFPSTIIDHKTWRPSNSDTDANFAVYLANYQRHRTYQ